MGFGASEAGFWASALGASDLGASALGASALGASALGASAGLGAAGVGGGAVRSSAFGVSIGRGGGGAGGCAGAGVGMGTGTGTTAGGAGGFGAGAAGAGGATSAAAFAGSAGLGGGGGGVGAGGGGGAGAAGAGGTTALGGGVSGAGATCATAFVVVDSGAGLVASETLLEMLWPAPVNTPTVSLASFLVALPSCSGSGGSFCCVVVVAVGEFWMVFRKLPYSWISSYRMPPEITRAAINEYLHDQTYFLHEQSTVVALSSGHYSALRTLHTGTSGLCNSPEHDLDDTSINVNKPLQQEVLQMRMFSRSKSVRWCDESHQLLV